MDKESRKLLSKALWDIHKLLTIHTKKIDKLEKENIDIRKDMG